MYHTTPLPRPLISPLGATTATRATLFDVSANTLVADVSSTSDARAGRTRQDASKGAMNVSRRRNVVRGAVEGVGEATATIRDINQRRRSVRQTVVSTSY